MMRLALRDKRIWLAVLIASLVGVILMFAPEIAHADDGIGFSKAADEIAILIANLILWAANIVASIALRLLEILLVPIVSYSNFIRHPVVMKGWVLVRDLVNIGFIATLLMVAFGTMFGIGRINWRQQIPLLLVGAIAVNFSKLVVGLIIDIGQVVMIAFVNAIKAVGAGNFIELLQFKGIMELSSGGRLEALDLLGASVLALVMSVIILIVILVIVAVLAYRIVVLWVLIILSPIAFLIGSAKGIFTSVGGEYAEWWNKLVAAVTVGPVLLFFLWLAMASVSGGGGIASDFFPGGEPPAAGQSPIDSSGIGIQAMTSFIIAIALLLAGLEVAQRSAGQLGGLAAQAVAKGKGLATAAAGAPIAGAAFVGGLAARKGAALGKAGVKGVALKGADLYRGTTAGAREKFRAQERRRAERLALSRNPLQRAVGRASLANIAKREAADKARQAELAKKYEGQFSTMSHDEKKKFIERAQKGGIKSEATQAKIAAMQNETVMDKDKFADALKNDPTTAREWYKSAYDRAKASGDEATVKRLDGMAESRPSLQGKGRAGTAAALKGMGKNQLLRIDASEFENPEMLAAAFDAGLFDEMKKDDSKGYSKAMKELADRYGGLGAKGRRDNFLAAADSHERDRSSIARNGALNDDQRKDAYRANDANLNYHTAVAGGDVAGALKAGKFKLEDLKIPTAGSAQHAGFIDELTKALQEAGSARAITSLNQASSTDNKNGAQQIRAEAMRTFIATAPMMNAIAAATGDAKKEAALATNGAALTRDATHLGYNDTSSKFDDPDDERSFKANIVSSPNLVLNFTSQLDANNGTNGLNRSVAESFNKDALRTMLESLDAARGSENEGEQQQVIARIGAALETYEGKLSGDIKEQVDEAARYFRARVKKQIGRRELE